MDILICCEDVDILICYEDVDILICYEDVDILICYEDVDILICYEGVDIGNKLSKSLKSTGVQTIRLDHRKFERKQDQIFTNNRLALPALLYCGSENWTVKARDARRITAAEMKYLRQTARHTGTGHTTKTENAKGLNINTVLYKIQE